MLTYIIRRLLTAIFILLSVSFIVYFLLQQAGDPLDELVAIQDPTQRELRERFIRDTLNLDTPVMLRYFGWLGDVLPWDFDTMRPAAPDWGMSLQTQQSLNQELGGRILASLKLVAAATALSVIFGVAIGIISALRQYSGLDYVITFFTFLWFSLPVFFVAVVLKDRGAIDFNDWLREVRSDGAGVPVWFFVVAVVLAVGIGHSAVGGTLRRKLLGGTIGGGIVLALLLYVSHTQWILNPGLGIIGVAVLAVGIAVLATTIMTGWQNRRARYTALTTAGIGVLLYLPLQAVFDGDGMNLWLLAGLGVVAVVVGIVVGFAYGGFDRGQSARTGALVAFMLSGVVFLDRTMQSWQDYSESSAIRGRPIRTFGDREYRIGDDFWLVTVDTFTHLLLPTLSLMLLTLASYTRYSRASMLEVMNQDYIRTARSKGLTQRTVVVRHAFRNSMIPLATIVAFDVAGLVSGAIVTERVFGWEAMAALFIDALQALDPNPVMAFVLVTGIFAIAANLLADLMYAVLDPRIRVTE